MPTTTEKAKHPRKRDAEATKRRILQAALEEFAAHGHSGARIDRLADAARVSKPMIYDYFGDKDAIYATALREAYVRIRDGEASLDMGTLPPDQAVRELVRFTMNHFRRNPWFISMLSTENLRGGETIRALSDAPRIRSVLVERLREVLSRGADVGMFRKNVDPVELYVFIASLCYFPISNKHTLRAVFQLPVDDDWLERHCEQSADMILAFLKR